MDSMLYVVPDAPRSSAAAVRHSLKAAIGCVGTGLHTGRRIAVSLRPAPAGTGIVFRRTDLPGNPAECSVAARWDQVSDTRLCTVLASPGRPDVRVGTVEHLMAALAACGIDDVVVDVDGPEIPVLDGSAASWLFLLDCAGLSPHAARTPEIEVLRPVRVGTSEAFAELRPNPAGHGLHLSVSIAFDAAAIGRQALTLALDQAAFRAELGFARTFALREEIDAMRRAGLAQGGTLDNAVVVDGARVLNPGGLLAPDEFVRHKMLDAVGDLALAGAPLRARFFGFRSGHALNNQVLRALFADQANWRWSDEAWAELSAAA